MFIATRETLFSVCLDLRKKINFSITAICSFTEPKRTNVFFSLSKGNDKWSDLSKRVQAHQTEHGYAVLLSPGERLSLSLEGYTVCIENINNTAILSVSSSLYNASYIVPKLEIEKVFHELLLPN